MHGARCKAHPDLKVRVTVRNSAHSSRSVHMDAYAASFAAKREGQQKSRLHSGASPEIMQSVGVSRLLCWLMRRLMRYVTADGGLREAATKRAGTQAGDQHRRSIGLPCSINRPIHSAMAQ